MRLRHLAIFRQKTFAKTHKSQCLEENPNVETQESLANAKVNARQQGVYDEGPYSEEIYDESTQGTC